MRCCLLVFTFVTVSVATHLVEAQEAVPAHHLASSAIIDGAEHPELIPDLTACRLYLAAVSEPPDPTVEQRNRQNARLRKIGLDAVDLRTLMTILADFYSGYHGMIDKYNEDAMAAWERLQRTDKAPLLLQRDDLVRSTRDNLKRALSSDGWARFEAYIQGEKSHMRISASEVKP